MTEPDLSIIIVNWNVRELLQACLRSVFVAGGIPTERLRVIVVDNASADGSADMVRTLFPQVQLMENTENVGFGQANNQALPHCAGRYTLLLNPDTVVEDDGIARMVDIMSSRPAIDVLGCRLLNADRSLQRWTGGAYPRLLNVASHYLFLDRLLPPSWRPLPLYLDRDVPHDLAVDWISGAVMLLRTERLGGALFNPQYFMYGEDMELCHRLKQAGGEVVYTPAVSIVHYQGASMKQQRGDVLLSSLKGPRQFYRQMRGGRGLGLYDLITVTGFALRWALFGGASLVRPRSGLRAKALSSRDMTRRAWAILCGGRA